MTGDSPSTDDVARSGPTMHAPETARRDDRFELRVTGLESARASTSSARGVPHAPTTFRPAADDAPVASGGTPEAAASATADA